MTHQQQPAAALTALVVVDLQRQRGFSAIHRSEEEPKTPRGAEAAA
jgi:hypothetical protein